MFRGEYSISLVGPKTLSNAKVQEICHFYKFLADMYDYYDFTSVESAKSTGKKKTMF